MVVTVKLPMKLYTNFREILTMAEVLALPEFLKRPLISLLFLPQTNPMRTELTYFKTQLRLYAQ